MTTTSNVPEKKKQPRFKGLVVVVAVVVVVAHTRTREKSVNGFYVAFPFPFCLVPECTLKDCTECVEFYSLWLGEQVARSRLSIQFARDVT